MAVDNRFPSPGVDTRFPGPGQDTRFPAPGIDSRFPAPGVDARFSGGFENQISQLANINWWDAKGSIYVRAGDQGEDGNPADLSPVGVWLDRAKFGMTPPDIAINELPELLTNPDFTNNIDGWADHSDPGGTTGWNSAGYLEVVHGTGNARISQSAAVVPGETYRIRVIIPPTSDSGSVLIGSSTATQDLRQGPVGPGTTDVYVTATTNVLSVSLRLFDQGNLQVDSVSVKQVGGLALSAPATGSQPRWSASGGLIFDGVDDTLDSPPLSGEACDIFAVVQSTDNLARLIEGVNGTEYLFHWSETGGSSPVDGGNTIGSPTLHVNNGGAIADRAAAFTAIAGVNPVIMEARSADLSSVADFGVNRQQASPLHNFGGTLFGLVVSTPLTAGQRLQMYNALAGYYGVTL